MLKKPRTRIAAQLRGQDPEPDGSSIYSHIPEELYPMLRFVDFLPFSESFAVAVILLWEMVKSLY